MIKEKSETEYSLEKAKSACKLICLVMKAVFVFLCIWWLVSVVVIGSSLLNPELLNNATSVNVFTLVIYATSVVVMVMICLTLIKVFSDTSKGESPFTMLQVRRLRLVSVALLAYAILEFAMSCNAVWMQEGWMNVSANGEVATMNLFPLVAAAVVFAFSFVFKYGVLLQEFSDETI